MSIAIFPGSFDPPTLGHLNIIERARSVFDALHVVVGVNKGKNHFFSYQERVTMLKELVSQWPNVSVVHWDGLITEYAKACNGGVLVRGVRNVMDFSYEFELGIFNKNLAPGVETILFPSDPKFCVVSSSAIKELLHFGGDVSSMVPPGVLSRILVKQGQL